MFLPHSRSGAKALRGLLARICLQVQYLSQFFVESMASGRQAMGKARHFFLVAQKPISMERRTGMQGLCEHSKTRAKRRERVGGADRLVCLCYVLAVKKRAGGHARLRTSSHTIVSCSLALIPGRASAMGFGLLQRLLRARSDRLNGRSALIYHALLRALRRIGTAIRSGVLDSFVTRWRAKWPWIRTLSGASIPHDWALRSACWRRSSATGQAQIASLSCASLRS